MLASARLSLSLAVALALPVVSAFGADTRRPILISVDDLPAQGPHPVPADRVALNERLLAVLAKHKVPAVGLVVWARVKTPADEGILRSWLAAGHELGSHSNKHLNFSEKPVAAYLADLEAARVGLGAFLAKGREKRTLRFFRFPFLNEGDTVEKLEAGREHLRANNLRNLPVTIDTQDWSFEEPYLAGDVTTRAAVLERYTRAIQVSVEHHERHGDALFGRQTPQILLLHANAVGADGWDGLFTWLTATGHRFATADEVMADPAFAEPHTFVFRHGTSLWDRLEHERHWKKVQADIKGLLDTQSAAWTRGDLEAFCSVYAEDALFISPDGETRGRQTVLERYRKRYPTKVDMGALTLEILEMRPLWGPEVTMLNDSVPSRIHGVSIAAKWHLKKTGKPDASGRTLIVFQRLAGRWQLVQDASM